MSAGNILTRLVDSEDKKFLIGQVLIPLMLATAALVVGSCVAQNIQAKLQDWQDTRSRGRDIIDDMREANGALISHLKTLAEDGATFERMVLKKDLTPQLTAVYATLDQIDLMAPALEKSVEASHRKIDVRPIEARSKQCRKNVEAYANHLINISQEKEERSRGNKYTREFNSARKEDTSCKGLASSIYSVIY